MVLKPFENLKSWNRKKPKKTVLRHACSKLDVYTEWDTNKYVMTQKVFIYTIIVFNVITYGWNFETDNAETGKRKKYHETLYT